MSGRLPIGLDDPPLHAPPMLLLGVATWQARRALREVVQDLKARDPEEYDLNHYLNSQQLAHWPAKWLSNGRVHVPHLFEDVQEDMEMDPINPMNPSESRKGPEIDKTININFVKRVHAFAAFVDMQDGKDPILVSRSLPARLRHSANSPTHADIVGKVKTTSGDLYKKIQKWSLLLAIHIIDCDQFEARDLDLSTQASAASFIKLRLDATPMLRPFVILRLVGNVIDSQFVYQELNPVVPKYLTLRDTIRDVCDKRVEYWVYLTMLYRVCHVCHGPKRGQGKFDEFKEHMRTHVFRQNEVFPVPSPPEWPTYKTVMSNYRNPWDMKQVKQSPFNPHWDNNNAKNPLAAPVYAPGIGGPGIGPVADQQRFQAQQLAAQALPPPILVPNPLPANYQLPAGYVIIPGSPAPVPGQQWALYHPPQQQNQGQGGRAQ